MNNINKPITIANSKNAFAVPNKYLRIVMIEFNND